MENHFNKEHHSPEVCSASIMAVKDALYMVSGKWKLPLIVALAAGPQRFNDIQRALDGITPKILAKELRELEQNELVVRRVIPSTPVIISYELTPYSQSLHKVVDELKNWGMQHRERIVAGMRKLTAV
ncbi:winged helix-turn-helix transcriptional regulator [Mucilaginibacter sp. X4EP1]|jgi:DNA-binding HxlR family transcriptional regulator|uniref:winged helix-turn-helix transcriptional regulator n=1 Tax=Mucilaginibacter sp. X4EP1 TaxID=2723092 RepID=UPI0021675846|nr:helix-turn-helix domain-containing protein [Mucilaginibacter sp. X4EP1]MCS3812160.1 DNA-binding HxlR family transcriptional regulator [Mucilaginibacter sp. X4EP1]